MKKVNKADMLRLLDGQLVLIENDTQQIRDVITIAIDNAIDNKLQQFTIEIKIDRQKLEDNNNLLDQVSAEQQKFIERVQWDNIRNTFELRNFLKIYFWISLARLAKIHPSTKIVKKINRISSSYAPSSSFLCFYNISWE